MRDFLYQNGWGAFAMMLSFEVPFALVFLYVIYRKAVAQPRPAETKQSRLARVEGLWIALVLALFITVNVASIRYMPTVSSAQAAQIDEQALQQVEVTARSWAFEISDRELEAGRPVRFSIKSTDTMHGFAVYHPDGRLLFTTMLVPGVTRATSIVHTFTEPGRYRVRCLEYCGIAHHAMQDELIVTKTGG